MHKADNTAQMTILAIECSSAMASVALQHRGEVRSRDGEAASATVDHLLRWSDELLRELGVDPEDIDVIAVGVGPGAFTGVRVAISVAQGLALAWQRPVIPVSSLAAVSTDALDDAAPLPVLALMDARMDEVYAGWFESADGGVRGLSPEQVLPPEGLTIVSAAECGYRIVGNGHALYAARIESALPPPAQVLLSVPTAAHVGALAAKLGLAAAVAPEQVEPAYLRNKVALTTAEREQQAASRR